jgi:hypothetical protein
LWFRGFELFGFKKGYEGRRVRGQTWVWQWGQTICCQTLFLKRGLRTWCLIRYGVMCDGRLILASLNLYHDRFGAVDSKLLASEECWTWSVYGSWGDQEVWRSPSGPDQD